MTLREKIEVMQAFERGEEIQVGTDEGWLDDPKPNWSWNTHIYRIKPKTQTVVIEKWLCLLAENSYYVTEGTKDVIKGRGDKVKLLETYEVEL